MSTITTPLDIVCHLVLDAIDDPGLIKTDLDDPNPARGTALRRARDLAIALAYDGLRISLAGLAQSSTFGPFTHATGSYASARDRGRTDDLYPELLDATRALADSDDQADVAARALADELASDEPGDNLPVLAATTTIVHAGVIVDDDQEHDEEPDGQTVLAGTDDRRRVDGVVVKEHHATITGAVELTRRVADRLRIGDELVVPIHLTVSGRSYKAKDGVLREQFVLSASTDAVDIEHALDA